MGHWKGGVGEREVISLIQPWWRQVEPDATFTRTPGSGAWAKKRKVPPGFKGHGDLIVDPETCRSFPWSIEVKWRNVVSLTSIQNFLAGKKSPVWEFWESCQDDAERNDLVPMLWLRGENLSGKGKPGGSKGFKMPWRVVTMEWKSISQGRQRVRTLYLQDEFLARDPRTYVEVA